MIRSGFCALFLCLATPALAADMGPLNEYLAPFSEGGWTLTDQGKGVLLENSAADGAIKYFFVGQPGADVGDRRVTTFVSLTGAVDGAASGLMYGLSEDRSSYILYTIAPDDTLQIAYFERGKGLSVIQQTQMDGVSAEGVELMLEEAGNSVSFFRGWAACWHPAK